MRLDFSRLDFSRLDFRRLGLPDWTAAGAQYEFRALAHYNAERGRGLLHTEDWDRIMAREQTRFDKGEPSLFKAERLFLAMEGRAARIGDSLPEREWLR